MKKIISIVLSVFVLITSFGINSFATSNSSETIYNSSYTYFEDGSYVITTISEEISQARASTKSGQKTSTFYDSDNVAQWSATLKGTFTYSGSSATCTASSITYTIYSSKLKVTSAQATKSGNKATGNVTAKRYLLGIPVQTINKTITLTCSASGVLS